MVGIGYLDHVDMSLEETTFRLGLALVFMSRNKEVKHVKIRKNTYKKNQH